MRQPGSQIYPKGAPKCVLRNSSNIRSIYILKVTPLKDNVLCHIISDMLVNELILPLYNSGFQTLAWDPTICSKRFYLFICLFVCLFV